MTENDYLNPADLKAQCDAAIARLERDNEALGTVENSLDTFVNDEEIKSKSYDALKQQISDYKVLLHAMQDANSSDISDFTVLKASVGDEVLDGANILAQKQAAWQLRENDESAAQGYERASWTAEYPWESWYYSWMADHYWQMAELDQQLYNAWQAKEDAFDAIEAGTKGLFQSSVQLRQTAQRGLESITGAFQGGAYELNMSAEWRTDLIESYTNRLIAIDEQGNATINWAEVEKVLQKEASEISDAEYQVLARVYLNADEAGMARFLGCCMDRKADVDVPWYSEALGPSAGLINQDYSEWVVNESKVGRIQAEIVNKSEELLGQMKIANENNKRMYESLKAERNLAIQRLTLISIVKEIGIFRGEYEAQYSAISITTGEEFELVMTFNEFRNVGSDYAPIISNLADSIVAIGYTSNGDNITKEVPDNVKLAFKAYFCNYSKESEGAEFLYDEATGYLIGKGSEMASQYVGKTLGKEVLGTAIKAVPFAGDVVGFGIDVAIEQQEQEKAIEFIEGEFEKIEKADIYSDFDCSVNFVQYDTVENSEYTLYAYEGEQTSERVKRVSALFQEGLEKGITQKEVFDLYEEFKRKDIGNKDRYDEAINNK